MTETEIDLDSISVSVICIQFQCDFLFDKYSIDCYFCVGVLGAFYGVGEKGRRGT